MPDSQVLALVGPTLRIYFLLSDDQSAWFIFDEVDECYALARAFARTFFTNDVEPEERRDRLHMGLVRLRDLRREPHPVAKRGCIVAGHGVWPEEEFPFVRDTEADFPAARFGFVGAALEVGPDLLIATCIHPIDDEEAKQTCLAVIEGAQPERRHGE